MLGVKRHPDNARLINDSLLTPPSPDQYVELACRLGTDRDWREAVMERIGTAVSIVG